MEGNVLILFSFWAIHLLLLQGYSFLQTAEPANVCYGQPLTAFV